MWVELEIKAVKQVKENIKEHKRVEVEEKKDSEEENIKNKKTKKAL